MESKCLTVFKRLALLLSLGLFLFTSIQTLLDFISGKTVVISQIKKTPDGLYQLPHFMICNKTAYKSPQVNNLEMETFLQNTLDLQDFFHAIQKPFLGSSEKIDYKIEPIYAPFRGRCYLFNIKERMLPQNGGVVLIVKPNSQLEIFFLEDGDEFWTLEEFWPKIPKAYPIDIPNGILEISIKKSVTSRNIRCNSSENYDRISKSIVVVDLNA